MIFIYSHAKTKQLQKMRKTVFFSVIVLSISLLASCDKIEKLLFQPFESPLNFDVPIDVVNNTTAETIFGGTTVSYNLNEAIKAETDGKLDGSVVNAMYLKEVAIDLSNADAENNLGNFEYISLAVSSGNATPVVFGTFAITSTSTNSATFTIPNSPNIKQFFTGSNVKFELRGKAHTATTKVLQSNIGATIKFDK